MLRGVELDQLAKIHEAGKIGDSCRLLQIVGHDDDGVILLQLIDGFLDLGR
jgi:hypothetical protein